MVSRFYYKNITDSPIDVLIFGANIYYVTRRIILIKKIIIYILPGVEFRQKIYLSDGQVDLQNHLSVMKSTCPTQENHKIKRLFNVAP